MSIFSTQVRGNKSFRPPEYVNDKAFEKGDIWSIAAYVLYMLSPEDLQMENYYA